MLFPKAIFTSLEESAVAQWVGSADTLLAYSTILTLHTDAMSIVVGTCAVIDLGCPASRTICRSRRFDGRRS